MAFIYKNRLPLAITLVVSIIIMANYYTGVLATLSKDIKIWASMISIFTIILATISFLLRDVRDLIKRTPDRWHYSILELVIAFLPIIIALFHPLSQQSSYYKWILDAFIVTQATIARACTTFFLVAIIFKRFRVRNMETLALLVAFSFALIKNIPTASLVWVGLPEIGRWILDYVSTAGYRGIYISAAIGGIALTLRTLVGREKGYSSGVTE